ncbi:MAG: AI-2E family transporter, partial [Williamsia herbipolensis]|nr:AI-2E family transporter [Williamsia herbipolensis]
AFIPIVGALTAGALSVLIALVSNGLTNALIVLVLILAVQQIEGNLLQPLVQGRGLGLHAAVVILAVTGGSSVAGIVGAFLAVPAVAVAAEILRYVNEQIDLRARSDDEHPTQAPRPTDAELLAAQRPRPAGRLSRWVRRHRAAAEPDDTVAAEDGTNPARGGGVAATNE